MSRVVRAFITLNPNPNFKKLTFFSKRERTKIDLLHLDGVDYNLISSRSETYSTLPRQSRL